MIAAIVFNDNQIVFGRIVDGDENGVFFIDNMDLEEEERYITLRETRDIVLGERDRDWWEYYREDLREQDRTRPSCSWRM